MLAPLWPVRFKKQENNKIRVRDWIRTVVIINNNVDLINYHYVILDIVLWVLNNLFHCIQCDIRIHELHDKQIVVMDMNKSPYNAFQRNLQKNKKKSVGKMSDYLRNFKSSTFWANIFTMSSHPTVITNTVSIIFTTPCKVFTFANLITILTVVTVDKKTTFPLVLFKSWN